MSIESTEVREARELLATALGYEPYIANPNEIFAVILNEDFTGIVPNRNVASVDDLSDYVSDIVKHDGAGWGTARVIARSLADGIWSKIRSFEYTAKTQNNAKLAAQSVETGRLRAKYDEILSKNPKLLEFENTELLLGMQRDYKVIDLETYTLLYNNHAALMNRIREAENAARKTVLAG